VKIRREGRFVVVGVDVADGYASSLLLAARAGRRLVYVCRVEWGVTRGAIERVLAGARRRITPACTDAERWRDVVWLKPRVVVEVTYSELMEGRLRDPVLRTVGGPTARVDVAERPPGEEGRDGRAARHTRPVPPRRLPRQPACRVGGSA
jgi:ATP-dependent DNA ligase